MIIVYMMSQTGSMPNDCQRLLNRSQKNGHGPYLSAILNQSI